MAKKTTTKKRQEPASKQPALTGYAGLPPEHQRFVDEYIIDFNATRAYMRVPGNSQNEKSASVLAARLLGKVCIQDAVAERKAASTKRCEMSADRIILEAARIATFDIRKLYNPDGSMKLPHELDDDTAAGVVAIDIDELFEGAGKDRKRIGTTKKVRTVDKKASVELAMKHLGLLKEKLEVDPSDKMIAFIRSLQGTALLPVASPPADEDDD